MAIKLISKRVFKLDFLGTEWKDCFITFSSVSIRENKSLINSKLSSKSDIEIVDITNRFLLDHFIDGVVYDFETQSTMPLQKKDFDLLPNEVQEKAILFLVGGSTQ